MTSRERVQAAFAQSEPDYPPADYFCTPEIQEALLAKRRADALNAYVDKLRADAAIEYYPAARELGLQAASPG